MDKRKRTDNTMDKRKRTDNTMDKRKRTDNIMDKRKRTNNDLQPLHIIIIKVKVDDEAKYAQQLRYLIQCARRICLNNNHQVHSKAVKTLEG
jgi:hypothetical protein